MKLLAQPPSFSLPLPPPPPHQLSKWDDAARLLSGALSGGDGSGGGGDAAVMIADVKLLLLLAKVAAGRAGGGVGGGEVGDTLQRARTLQLAVLAKLRNEVGEALAEQKRMAAGIITQLAAHAVAGGGEGAEEKVCVRV